jgi:hypothetical protein
MPKRITAKTAEKIMSARLLYTSAKCACQPRNLNYRPCGLTKDVLSRISHEHCVDLQNIPDFQEDPRCFNFSLDQHNVHQLNPLK